MSLTLANSSLERYVHEVARHPVLARDEELRLALRYRDHSDVEAAHALVVANLRFVVRVAYEYKGYGLKMLDMIQEGNIGLMHAVKKFDPDRGYRLISYAVWWIRAHIQNFILSSWSLVKVGSGRIKRKLFFKLRSSRSRLEHEAGMLGEERPDTQALAQHLGVSESDISDMEARLAARDFSLDAPLGADTDSTHLDTLDAADVYEIDDQAQQLVAREERQLLGSAIANASGSFNEKEHHILQHRLLSDEPQTLQEVGEQFGISRQRVQQIENRVVDKLRAALPAHAQMPRSSVAP